MGPVRTIFCVTVMHNEQRKDQAVPVSEMSLDNYWSLYPCPVRPVASVEVPRTKAALFPALEKCTEGEWDSQMTT